MKLKGVSTSPRIVIGDAMRYVPFTCEVEVREFKEHDAAKELSLYQEAKEKALGELDGLGGSLQKSDPSNVDFVAAHKEILNDPLMDSEIRQLIEKRSYCTDSAVAAVFDQYRGLFAKNKNALIREKASDLQDVKFRLLRCYFGKPEKNLAHLEKPCVIVAEELFPSDTLCLDAANVKGIITENGSLTSHTAIIARTLDIPALLGAEGLMAAVEDGAEVILDGAGQEAILDADEAEIQAYFEKAVQVEKDMGITRLYYGRGPVALDGTKVDLRIDVAEC